MPGPLLDIKNLSVFFINDQGSTKTLNNINISVNRGEIFAIVGESGSGKSVSALSILRLLPSPPAEYSSGEILFRVDDELIDLLKVSSKKLETIRGNRIAMVFQEPMTSLNPVLTCGLQVMEAIQQHSGLYESDAKLKTIALFEKVKLPDPIRMFTRFPHQLSGGQKQRVMIAMAMSCDPDLLICDEPTTALDVTVQKSILQLIKNLQSENNLAVIFISHDLSVVSEIADTVAVMYKGEIVEQQPTANLFSQPIHPYTKALLACRPQLHRKGERLPIVSDFMEVSGEGKMMEKSGVRSGESGVSATIELPTPNSRLLTVKSLSVHFPNTKTFLGKITSYIKAVDDVSFELYEGETLGLVGESGCGKSTLGRAILRLIDITSGEINYKGIDLLKAKRQHLISLRKEMQIIFQDPYSSLNPRITIGNAIAEPLWVHGLEQNPKKRKERVIELLEKVNLGSEHYNRYPHEFSGGQRQRIVIARALALSPTFIVCDESVSALDVSVQAQVLNLLNDLKKEFRFTAIFISHDLSVVKYISDRILVMNKGHIEESGTAEEVCNTPQSAYTQQLIASVPKGMFT